MTHTLGLDIGSTYTKAVVLDDKHQIIARCMRLTGSRLQEVAAAVTDDATSIAGLNTDDIGYCIATGFGRHQYSGADLQVTDLTATARGASFLFPGTRTVLDIGGQMVKASRIDDAKKVRTFRLNDKCASGTGMFLEKTAGYLGYETDNIGELLQNAKEAVPISGVCTVFAESEVINHLSNSVPPEDIMLGASMSLTKRSVQLLKRIRIENEVTLVGGILRWDTISKAISDMLGSDVNVSEGDLPQYTAALGCAILGHVWLTKNRRRGPGRGKREAA